MVNLEGKNVLVTGASSGIGAVICKELLLRGCNVVGCARTVEKIEAIAKDEMVQKYKGNLTAIKCDLRHEDQIKEMHKKIRSQFSVLDVCINNAVYSKDSSLLSEKTEDWKNILDVGVLGLCINTREAVEHMEGSEIGQIIHMGSITGSKLPPWRNHPDNEPFPWFHIYNGMKAMVKVLADGLRQELIATSKKIRVATITPGSVHTGLLERATNKETAEKFYSSYVCLNPEDVFAAIEYVLKAPPQVSVNEVVIEPVAYHMAL